MWNILIADDHAVVRKGVQNILASALGPIRFGEAGNAQETLDLVQRQSWDLVVLDVSMPGRNGLEVLQEWARPTHRPPVLILSVHPEAAYAVRAFKCGASGYVNKLSDPEEIVRAVRKVLSGGKYITPTLAEKLASDLEDDGSSSPHELLSVREYEVMCLLASGRTLKEAAGQLSLSPKTVSTYRTRLMEKMRMRTNAELTCYAYQNGLLDRTQP